MKTKKLQFDRETGQLRSTTRPLKPAGFIRGPISLDWAKTAAQLQGKAFHLGMLLWYLAGLKGCQSGLVVSNEQAAKFGISRFAKARALKVLVDAKLVMVEQKGKASPRVTLLMVKRGSNSASITDKAARAGAYSSLPRKLFSGLAAVGAQRTIPAPNTGDGQQMDADTAFRKDLTEQGVVQVTKH